MTTSVARCRREKSGGKKQVGLLASCSTTEYYVKQIYKGNSCEMMTQISCTVISCELQFCVHVLEFTCSIFIWNLCILFSNEFHAKSDTYMQNTWKKEEWQCKERNLYGVFWFVLPEWPTNGPSLIWFSSLGGDCLSCREWSSKPTLFTILEFFFL